MAKDVKVAILGDASSFKKAVAEAKGSADDAEGHFGKVSDGFKKLGTAMAAGVAAAAVAGAAFAKSAISAASDLNESLGKSQVVFGDSAKDIEAWAGTAAKAFGQSKQQALEAVGTYGNLFQAFGVGRTESAKMSKSLVELAADLASFNNTSVDDALQALQSGLSGETEPLKKFGIAVNDDRLKTEALKLGLISSTKDALTPAAKAQAAYALIMKDSTLAQGDFARTSDGLANQQRILSAQWQDVQASIGQKLLPVMLALVSFINENLLPAIGNIGQFLRDAGEWVSKHKDLMIALAIGVASVLVPALAAWAASAATAAAATIAATAPVIAIAAAVAALAAGVIYAYKHWGWFRSAVDAVGAALGVAWNAIKAFASWLADDFVGKLELAGRVLLAVFTLGMSEVARAIYTNWDVIKEFFGRLPGEFIAIGRAIVDGLLNGIKGAWHSLTDWVGDAVGGLTNVAKGVLGIHSPSTVFMEIGEQITAGLAEGIASGSDDVMRAMQDLSKAVISSFDATLSSFTEETAFQRAGAQLADSLRKADEEFRKNGGVSVDTQDNIRQQIAAEASIFARLRKAQAEAAGKTFTDMDRVREQIAFLEDLNSKVGASSPMKGAIAGLLAALAGNIAIPALAQGGIAMAPTLAVVGDNGGRGEAVIPLDKLEQMMGNGAGGEFHFYLDGRELSATLRRINRRAA